MTTITQPATHRTHEFVLYWEGRKLSRFTADLDKQKFRYNACTDEPLPDHIWNMKTDWMLAVENELRGMAG